MPWVTGTIQNIFNVVLRHAAAVPAFPTADPFLALFTTPPTIDGSGFVEVNSTILPTYARQQFAFAAATGTSRLTSNIADVTFVASASGVSSPIIVTHGGVFSALTGGVMLAYGLLATQLTITNGSLVRIPANNLTIQDNVVT